MGGDAGVEEPWSANYLAVLPIPLFGSANLQCRLSLKPGVRGGILALPAVDCSVATPHQWATAGNSCSGEFRVTFKG